MCYSPEASFLVGTGLTWGGVATFRRALHHNRSMILFALFPGIFALHQLIEGFVWLSIDEKIDGRVFRYLYVFIAFLVWPVLTPVAAMMADKDKKRKYFRYAVTLAGVAATSYLIVKLANASGIEAVVVGHSISYVIAYTKPPFEFDLAYAGIVLASLLTFPSRPIKALGVLVALSFAYTYSLMQEVWQSVWCLSAALFSGLIYFSIEPQEAQERALREVTRRIRA